MVVNSYKVTISNNLYEKYVNGNIKTWQILPKAKYKITTKLSVSTTEDLISKSR